MATISLQSLRKSFGESEVIHGVDMEIDDGEFIVIVGPSGCGKSTLLRMVAGLESVTSGEIRIDGARVNDLEPMDRNIAMVFQNYALYPHMSVFDNMAYGLKIARKPKAEIKEKVAKVTKLLQLDDLLDRKPRQLSGGQRQRVAMGRAIVREPALFLFDEPLSNLDAKLRVQMRLEIKALQRQLGITSLYVTHDQVEAMTLADRMIVLNQGVAEQIGAPLEVYKRPATRFVGGFIGSPPMNFIAAALCQAEKLQALLPRDLAAPPADLVIGIRPEGMAPSQKGDHLFAGTVKFTEALGAETLVHLALEDSQMVTIRQAANLPLPPTDSHCYVTCATEALAFFQASGERLQQD